MRNKALKEIENKIRGLRPERITMIVDVGGKTAEFPVCEVHRMLHAGVLKFDDIQGNWGRVFANVGNCSADLEAWFHILHHHVTGIHGELSKEKGWKGISEAEAHEKLLKDMASGQTVKL